LATGGDLGHIRASVDVQRKFGPCAEPKKTASLLAQSVRPRRVLPRLPRKSF
jgi:hypothetical protein